MSYKNSKIQLNGTEISERVETINFTGVTVTDSGGHKVTVDVVGGSTPNLWETITADSGSVIANLPTDTLNILGTTSEIITSAATDNVIIGIADNPILPGTASVTVPVGTTAQRPGIPVVGMQRWNSTEACMEIYTGTAWECIRFQTSLVGGLYQMIFSVNGIIKNAWMDQGADNVTSNSSPAVILAKSRIVAYTFTNARINVSTNLEIYSTPEGVSPSVTQTLEDTWVLTTLRHSRKSNFGTDIIFDAGDKIGVFSNDVGGTTPNDAVFILFLQYLEENSEEVVDNSNDDMSV